MAIQLPAKSRQISCVIGFEGEGELRGYSRRGGLGRRLVCVQRFSRRLFHTGLKTILALPAESTTDTSIAGYWGSWPNSELA